MLCVSSPTVREGSMIKFETVVWLRLGGSVLLRWKFFAVWKEFFPEFSWDRTPLACMWWPLDCCCTLEACAPRNPGHLRVSAVNFFGCGYAAPRQSVSARE